MICFYDFCHTAVFAYHFLPSPHVHHIHHYYDYRNSSLSSAAAVKEPIIYDYKPPTSKNDSSSEESDLHAEPIDPNDVFIAGVENILFYGDMKHNQHQVIFIEQNSDGISLEAELLSVFGNFQDTNAQYFPDVEFRFDADDEPNDDDLKNIYQMYKDLVDNGRC